MSLLLTLDKSIDGVAPVIPLSPLDAPDADFLQWIDFSDNSRLNINLTNILNAYFTKTVDTPAGTYYVQGASSAPKTTGVINSLQAANFESSIRQLDEFASMPAGYNFAYPNMTWFAVIRPTSSGTQTGDVLSDYGVSPELIFLRVGDGSNLLVHAWMRDASSNVVEITSGVEYLSLDTDYLIVARYDGATKTISLWIDGATFYTATNASYDGATTFDGGSGRGRIGELSQFTAVNSYQGYIGSIFVAKVALSNADINTYASWMANKWGTTWTNI